METQKLTSEYRETSGKGDARKMRAAGIVPAVLYGHKEKTLSIAVNELELRRILAGNWETAIVGLDIKGKVAKECDAIIKDVQQHPATGRILHVDFQHIRRGEKIRLTVPISIIGEPKGVKEMGGVLEHGSRELAIRVLPRNFPDKIELDVSSLGIHDSLHVRDLVVKYPDLEFLDDDDVTLANVLPPRLEVEAIPAEGEEEAAEEPEVITKGKEEEEEKGEEGSS